MIELDKNVINEIKSFAKEEKWGIIFGIMREKFNSGNCIELLLEYDLLTQKQIIQFSIWLYDYINTFIESKKAEEEFLKDFDKEFPDFWKTLKIKFGDNIKEQIFKLEQEVLPQLKPLFKSIEDPDVKLYLENKLQTILYNLEDKNNSNGILFDILIDNICEDSFSFQLILQSIDSMDDSILPLLCALCNEMYNGTSAKEISEFTIEILGIKNYSENIKNYNIKRNLNELSRK